MIKPMGNVGQADLEKMKESLEQIEGHLLALQNLGGEMPVIEKNVRAMMSFVHALKFGISDIAEMDK
jgi:hypothetical protein